jgi:hypothetical protein
VNLTPTVHHADKSCRMHQVLKDFGSQGIDASNFCGEEGRERREFSYQSEDRLPETLLFVGPLTAADEDDVSVTHVRTHTVVLERRDRRGLAGSRGQTPSPQPPGPARVR